jgi:hypothetical protein
MPYPSSGPKKENLREIIYLQGDFTTMMQNFSKDAWIRHEVFVLAVVILICSCSGAKGVGWLNSCARSKMVNPFIKIFGKNVI